MRSRLFVFFVFSFLLFGCAAVFRDAKPKVQIESDPQGAHATSRGNEVGNTPTELAVERSGTTEVTVTKDGYATHNGIIKKKIDPGWLTVDILDCVFPVTLCIPLLIDAVSGAWNDVEKEHIARLEPLAGTIVATTATASTGAPAATTASTSTATAAGAQMSESERKATARAAYLEGVALQEKGDCASALQRFDAAEKLFDAPTHVLHIAQCQAQVGKLVEAQENYETLAHTMLAPNAAEAFKSAQETARKELPALQGRIPTLRVNVSPTPSTLPGLVVQVNGHTMPNDLLGIARPVNPGAYKITAAARGYKPVTPVDVTLKEGDAKPVDVKLAK